MELYFSKTILKLQDNNIKKINNFRFIKDGFEYRITYRGGFTRYVAIDRRLIGKRKFEYFGGIGAYDCMNVADVLNKIQKKYF